MEQTKLEIALHNFSTEETRNFRKDLLKDDLKRVGLGLAASAGAVSFRLVCYPNRESSKMYLTEPASTFGYGGMTQPTYEPSLHEWDGIAKIEEIFPSGIPLGTNAQKTAIYNWIKSYIGLPFEDVFEENQA